VRYSDFFLYVLSEVPGCPEFTAERAIRDACIDFCARTDIFRAEPATITLIPNITAYELDAPAGTEPNRVKLVSRAGRPLNQLQYEEAFLRIEASQPTAPAFWSQTDNSALLVGPKPKERERVSVLYSLKPTASSSSIPDTIGLEWRETLVSGALFRLQMMVGSPWANGAAAQANASVYEAGVKSAIKQAKYGHGGAPLTVNYREFI
jgi:hypothetical protein